MTGEDETCPTCAAQPGEPCVTAPCAGRPYIPSGLPKELPHRSRRRLASKKGGAT